MLLLAATLPATQQHHKIKPTFIIYSMCTSTLYFFPNLDVRSFSQEGHRLQWGNREKLQELERGGIVYNEMKGVYANPNTHLWQKLHEKLLCDTLYSVDSGGKPDIIPSLTHEQLKDFHAKYYNPSLCLYYFYGDIDTYEHAQFLHERLLHQVQKAPCLEPRTRQHVWRQPVFEKGVFPSTSLDPSADQSLAALSWLTCDIQNIEHSLMLELLDYLLMGHDGAPLKNFLINSGHCKQASSSLDAEMVQIPYTLILKDCAFKDSQTLADVIRQKLKQIHQEGFSKDSMASALHQLKLSRLEITGGSYPFGLVLFFRSGLAMQQGCDPVSSLRLHSHLQSLSALVDSSQPLLEVFKHYLLDNTHYVGLILEPDSELNAKEEQQEHALLSQLEAQLSESEKQKIKHLNEQLELEQKSPERYDILPNIPIQAISHTSLDFKLDAQPGNIQVHECFTNGFSYIDLSLDLPKSLCESLSLQNWHELKLLAYLWPRLGAAKKNYQEQLELLDLHSGGLETSLQLFNRLQEGRQLSAHFGLCIYGLSEKLPTFMPIFQSTLFEGRLDEQDRIKQLLQALKTSLQNSIPNQALQYAIHASSSGFTPLAQLTNWLGGVEFLRFVKHEADVMALGKSDLIERLQSLKEKLFASGPSATSILSIDSKSAKIAVREISKALQPLTSSAQEVLFTPALCFPSPHRAYSINSQVSFNALSLPGPALGDESSSCLRLACELIKHQVLHPEIREKGGAYGYGCSWSPEREVVTFHSYRDPHIQRTLEVFAQAAQKIAQGDYNEAALDEAKRCVIQQLDKPVTPSERGSLAYSWKQIGLTKHVRDIRRQTLLQANTQQVSQAANVWLAQSWNKHQICLFGPKQQIAQEVGLEAQNP